MTTILQKLAEEYTVVFLVDELDRCLPEYAIKVLERLHHLTEENSNIITVMALDKEQLKKSVTHIFGFDDPDKYLEKFINFEVKLDNGTLSAQVSEKYADYFELFDKELFEFDESVEECLQGLFINVDVRTQEQIIKRAMIAHKLLFNEKKDYSFMCMEVLITVMICVHNYDLFLKNQQLHSGSFDEMFTIPRGKEQPAFREFFGEKNRQVGFSQTFRHSTGPTCYDLPKEPNLYGAMAFTWYWMHKQNMNYVIRHTPKDVYTSIANNHKELKRFAEMIWLIK